MRRALSAALFLISLLSLSARAAQPAEEEGEEGPLSVGVKANAGRESNANYAEWGPTLSLALRTSRPDAVNRFKYEMELSYDDSWTKLSTAESNDSARVRTAELKYAKLSLLELRSFDFKKSLGFVPFVTGGLQYVDSRADQDGERKNDFYWAPTFGGGVDIALKKKLSLALEYEQNTERGDRKVTRFSLELKYDVFGRSAD